MTKSELCPVCNEKGHLVKAEARTTPGFEDLGGTVMLCRTCAYPGLLTRVADRVEVWLCETIGCTSWLGDRSSLPHRLVCNPLAKMRYRRGRRAIVRGRQ
jgi:hypothetical protein